MPDFLLELLTEEIPARMQARAAEQLRERFEAGIRGQLPCDAVRTLVTPRRLIMIATGLAAEGSAQEEERRGPRADAPAQALEGFLRSTGLTRDQLEERETPKGSFLYATIRTPGRGAAEVIAELVPQIVRDFDWPKSMRWGDASVSTSSPRWVRPLSSIVALLDGDIVALEAAGIASGRTTRGHRFMAREAIEIASAATYAEQLRAAKVLIDPAERARIITDGARAAAAAHGLTLIEDDGLVRENAGLTEWPVPLLGTFDPAFLEVPREVIQLTMRTNQKYFACTDSSGALAPAFVCVANLDAPDGGATIVAGNQKVLAARLSDAKHFWEDDQFVFEIVGQERRPVRRKSLRENSISLERIVFHESLGSIEQKIERIRRFALWLVEKRIVVPASDAPDADTSLHNNVQSAAILLKSDLVSATVGEFPEVQGIAGRYLALAEGLPVQVADAIRDHYKPVGQGDDVPTAPVSVAVALADKLDTIAGFFGIGERPTGSRDPFALRRAAIGVVSIVLVNGSRLSLRDACKHLAILSPSTDSLVVFERIYGHGFGDGRAAQDAAVLDSTKLAGVVDEIIGFIIDRLKVQQREAGIRPDIIDAVFALGGEDDLVRLLARVRALQAFIDNDDGANLLAGYRRAANILKIEEAKDGPHAGAVDAALLAEPAEQALAAALDTALPAAGTAVAAEDFTSAMTALASLRPAVDAFFDSVTVNADDPALRSNRLNLLNRLREAVHTVADFGRIEK